MTRLRKPNVRLPDGATPTKVSRWLIKDSPSTGEEQPYVKSRESAGKGIENIKAKYILYIAQYICLQLLS